IGTALENKRNEFIAQKETLRALVLDAAGSVAAEECIKSVNNSIKQEEEKKGNKTTKRFSCGYGDWILDSQKDFLFWLGADKIGIKTNDSFMMIPEKSISAIIGIKK
ncbi:MAG: methionine synthase, partial [Elusimicrobiota bacterium]|nr:methionine synthase [Elusimicrobiota bacterium]